MTFAKQIAANQANAKRSTGPRTDLGKLASSLNAVKHGLTGHIVLRTDEQDAAYNTYRARLYPDLAPGDAVELDFADRIVYDSWRVHRASAIESNIFALAEAAFDTGNTAQDDALNEAHAFQVNQKSINLLSLYQQRLQRAIHKDLAMLRQMQKERATRPAIAAPLSFQHNAEALKAAQQSHADAAAPIPYPVDSSTPPPADGFVCSTALADPAPPPQHEAATPENIAA